MQRLLSAVIIVGLSGYLLVTQTLAISLDFGPAAQTVTLGTTVDVAVVIAGPGAGGPPSLGAFDLDVSFDPSVLSPVGVPFGPCRGDPGLLEAEAGSTLLPGVVDFFAVSLLAAADLDALQPASFTLATLSFGATGLGSSALTFAEVIMGDAFAAPLSVVPGSGSVTVVPRAVPEPTTWALLGSGLAGLAWWRRRQDTGRWIVPGSSVINTHSTKCLLSHEEASRARPAGATVSAQGQGSPEAVGR